jgi:hypothetical protein
VTFYEILKDIQSGKQTRALSMLIAGKHDFRDYPCLRDEAKRADEAPLAIVLRVLRSGSAREAPELYADCYLFLDSWVQKHREKQAC